MARTKATKPTDKRTVTVPVTWTHTFGGSTKEVPEEFDKHSFDGTIPEVIARLQEMQDKYPGRTLKLEFETYYEPYDPSEYHRYLVKETRLETDEEVAKRIADDADRQAQWDARDRAEFERLSKLFNKDTP